MQQIHGRQADQQRRCIVIFMRDFYDQCCGAAIFSQMEDVPSTGPATRQ